MKRKLIEKIAFYYRQGYDEILGDRLGMLVYMNDFYKSRYDKLKKQEMTIEDFLNDIGDWDDDILIDCFERQCNHRFR